MLDMQSHIVIRKRSWKSVVLKLIMQQNPYYDSRILNIHPSLLPKFGGTEMYGMHVHEAVISAGENTSGASIYLIDEGYDTGVVIAQHTVDVLPRDTPESLASRIQGIESTFFTNTIRKIISGDIELPNIWS